MTQLHKVSGVKTSIFTDSNGDTCVKYHNTIVYRCTPQGRVTLDTGGWKTVTTKTRMNQALNQFGHGAQVFVRKGCWFIGTHQPYEQNCIPFHGLKMELQL